MLPQRQAAALIEVYEVLQAIRLRHQLRQVGAGLPAPAGETDLLCRVVARDPDDLYRAAEEIRLCPGISRTRTSVYLRLLVPYRTSRLLDA